MRALTKKHLKKIWWEKIWLEKTKLCSKLLESQIAQTKCKRLIRIDHSQKFCRMLKVFGSDGSKEQCSSVRRLLLVHNKIGQIVARGLTHSENHEESTAILRSVIPLLDTEAIPPPVCDDANKTRSMVTRVFGSNIETKQDPFHVIRKITEKLIDKTDRKALSKTLSTALYDVAGNLRRPEAMAGQVLSALRAVHTSSVRVSGDICENCILVNVEQIHRGDLFVNDNEYLESGQRIHVVSTSQLEAIHSKLSKLLGRMVSIEGGMRILDIFILKHNFKAGAKYKRKSLFYEFDLCECARLSCFAVVSCQIHPSPNSCTSCCRLRHVKLPSSNNCELELYKILPFDRGDIYMD